MENLGTKLFHFVVIGRLSLEETSGVHLVQFYTACNERWSQGVFDCYVLFVPVKRPTHPNSICRSVLLFLLDAF